MIGMVNAAGASQASRVQSFERDATKAPEPQQVQAPVLSAEQAANRVLTKAVEALQFQTVEGQRPMPSGDQSDAIKQVELERGSSDAVGQFLDLTA